MKNTREFLGNIRQLSPIFIDTESTGGEYWDEIIDLAAVDSNGRMCYHNNFKPAVSKFSSFAFNIHGKTFSDLKGCPTFESQEPIISSLLEGKFIIAYNAYSDARMLRQTYDRYGKILPSSVYICLEDIYRKLHGSINTISLANACRNYDLPVPNHDSLIDTYSAYYLFNKLIEIT